MIDRQTFFLTYLRRELQRRVRQTLLVASGLAVGIGVVITVTAASAGVGNAQSAVLHSLYGIGTDVTVTKAFSPAPNPTTAFSLGSKSQQVDVLSPAALGLLNTSAVTSISHLRGIAAAAGCLILTDVKLTVPSLGQLGPGGKPPASAFPASVTIDGVDLADLALGPFGSGRISSGRSFVASDANANVAVVDANYAAVNKRAIGSTITIANTSFKVIGILSQSQGGGAEDVYIPLRRAQALTKYRGLKSLLGKVNTIYVAAASAGAVSMVGAEIAKLLPSATVTSSGSLANAVSGSLASAANLTNDLGRWLAITVLVAAFVVASLLEMGAVARRVREFGTLKALGWSSRRIVTQIMGESAIVGVIGTVIGIVLGFGGAAVVNTVAPKLSATVAQNPGSPPPRVTLINSSGIHHQIQPGSTSTVAVHLTCAVTGTAIVLAVALAIAGALIAGSFGGWQAARLRPAEAMAQIE